MTYLMDVFLLTDSPTYRHIADMMIMFFIFKNMLQVAFFPNQDQTTYFSHYKFLLPLKWYESVWVCSSSDHFSFWLYWWLGFPSQPDFLSLLLKMLFMYYPTNKLWRNLRFRDYLLCTNINQCKEILLCWVNLKIWA